MARCTRKFLTIPIPHIFDQKIRAAKIYKLGYTCKPLNINKINSDILSDAIVQVKNNQEMKKKCIDAGIMVLNEKGTENSVELINIFKKERQLLTLSLIKISSTIGYIE